MPYEPRLVTPADSEPLTLEEVKSHLRVDHTADDEDLDALIVTARELVEADTGRVLLTSTWDLPLAGFPACGYIDLAAPLQSIESVTYYDTNNLATVWTASNYAADLYRTRGRLVLAYGGVWPLVSLRPYAGLVVRYVAGYGLPAAVPELLKRAMLLLIGHWYQNREVASGTGGTGWLKENPLGYRAIVVKFDARRY